MLEQRLKLNAAERREKQKILLRDTMALSVLAGLVLVLSFVTYALFHSFVGHRAMLEGRWRLRGEAALQAGKPVDALNYLHSALAYAPDDRGLQIELATALAASGRTQEAQVYFGTLLEAEPGNGMINLQLARLAARQSNAQAAVDYYQAAIDGTWNGDAFSRRREIRLELARYLITQGRNPEARNLLLITSGNAPDNHALQLGLGAMLQQAGDDADALDVFRKAAGDKTTRLRALEGEANAAAALGHFAEARSYLEESMSDAGFAHQPEPVREGVRASLASMEQLLALYPAPMLPLPERTRRITHVAELAQARLLACPAPELAGSGPSPGAPNASGGAMQQRAQLLTALGANLQKLNPLAHRDAATAGGNEAAGGSEAAAEHGATGGGKANPAGSNTLRAPEAQMGTGVAETPADPLAALAARWSAMPVGGALRRQLLADPAFAQNTLSLAYETERATAGPCGEPTGQDASLLRIAKAPEQVEVQP